MKRVLLLDLDGTLADSLHVLHACYARCAQRCGRTPRDSEFEEINGPPLPQIARLLAAKWGLRDGGAALLEDYGALIDDAYAHVVPADGAHDLLALAKRRDWARAVVTSNARTRTRRWLTRVGLDDLIDVVVAHEDVRIAKPAAEAYLRALELCDASADVSLAVEDSPAGVAAARAAKLATVAIDRHATPHWPAEVHVVPDLRGAAAFL